MKPTVKLMANRMQFILSGGTGDKVPVAQGGGG